MIFDSIQYFDRYSIPFIKEIQTFLNRKELANLQEPEIEICGRDLFVRIMRYRPKPANENKFETHRVYADVQVVLSGREIMQVAPTSPLIPLTEYHHDNDYQFFQVEDQPTSLLVLQQSFAVFFPGEVHRPSCLVSPQDGDVFKLVFKVRIS